MRHTLSLTLSLAVAAGGVPAFAQDRVFTEPYWTTRPVIETIGQASMEFPPNRAAFSVTFEATGDTAEEATRNAVDNARRGVEAIRARVPQGVRIATQISVEALYEQYRDREGNRIDNERADRISGYVARVALGVTIDTENLAAASEARAAAMAAGPQNTSNLSYALVTTDEMRRAAYAAAVADGHARAQSAAQATGRRLGTLLVAQDGRGPCLGQWTALPPGVAVGAVAPAPPPPPMAYSAPSPIVVTGSRGQAPITVEDIAALNMPADPNPVQVQSAVCLVYAIE